MYSTKYVRSILPILANAVFFVVVYLLVRDHLQIPWFEHLILLTFFLTIVPFALLPVEYEVYTRWEETFLKFWKTQYFQKEIKRRLMLFGIIPIGKEETVRVERTLRQPPMYVVLNDVLGNAELLVPVVNTAARLLARKRS